MRSQEEKSGYKWTWKSGFEEERRMEGVNKKVKRMKSRIVNEKTGEEEEGQGVDKKGLKKRGGRESRGARSRGKIIT